MRHFTPVQLKEYLQTQEPSPLLLDVREPWEFEVCAIDGARLIPMQEIPVACEELDPEQEIVLICHHGIRSRQVGYYMESAGFTRLINLSGGVAAWAQDVDPDMPVY
jgi:rhodanese-related sulfurtransferase